MTAPTQTHPDQRYMPGAKLYFEVSSKKNWTILSNGWKSRDLDGSQEADCRVVGAAVTFVQNGFYQRDYHNGNRSEPVPVVFLDDGRFMGYNEYGDGNWNVIDSDGFLDGLVSGEVVPVGVEESTPPRAAGKACHFELLPAPNRHQQIPDSVVAAALDRGECTIRRKLRAWPDGKRLDHTILLTETQPRIEWRWTDNEGEI